MKHDSFLLINHTSHPHPPPPRQNIKIATKPVTRPTDPQTARIPPSGNKLDTTERSLLLFSSPFPRPIWNVCLSVGGCRRRREEREGFSGGLDAVPVAEMGCRSFVSGRSVGFWRDAISEAGLGGWMCVCTRWEMGWAGWLIGVRFLIFDFDLG